MKPIRVHAIRIYRPVRWSPGWAYRQDYPMDAADRLNRWWRESECDEVRPPEWSDVFDLFSVWTDEQLIIGLKEMRTCAACLAAMGARGDKKFLPHALAIAGRPIHTERNFNLFTHTWEREMAEATCQQIDPLYRLYQLWDFLFAACTAHEKLELRQNQMRMF